MSPENQTPESSGNTSAETSSTNNTTTPPAQPTVQDVVPPSAVQSTPPASAQPETESPSTQPPVVTSSKKGGGKKWLWVLLIVVVLAALGYVGYKVLYKQNTTQQAASTTAAKRDIPYLTYAVRSALPISAYPLTQNTSLNIEVTSQMFEGLVRYQDRDKIVPLLATGWTNPDNNTWLFTLHSGVKFHSGRPLTPQDVKASLDYAVAHQNDNDGALSLASTIKTVTVVGANQVKITTDGPDPTLLNRLAELYIFDSKAKLGDPNAGTGPYTLKTGTQLNPNTLDLQAAANYWGGHVYTRAIHMVTVADLQKMQTQSIAGQFDVAGDFPKDSQAVKKAGQTFTVTDLGINFLGLNTEKTGSPLATLKGRQAVAAALNIPAIMKAANLDGEQANQLVPPSIPGYDPNLHSTPYNPTTAKQLLAAVPAAAAKQTLTLSYPASDGPQATEIIKELTAVGFKVQPQQFGSLDTLVPVALGGKTDMYFLGYGSDTLDGLDILSSILTGNADYSNPKVESLAKQASTTLDPSTRIKLLQQISDQAAADQAVVPAYIATFTFAIKNANYHLSSDIPLQDSGVYFWKVYQS